MQKAPVNKIIPFSSVDGPGNRTAVFLQGCNFDCKYCHNPETKNICNNCGACVGTCPTGALSVVQKKVQYDLTKCCNCDTCIKTCTNNASPKIREMTSKQVFCEIKKQMPFIRGITVSGGECMLYADFIQELFTICKENELSTFIDSNGSIDFSKKQKLLEVTDGIMLDIKAFDEIQHINVTGRPNKMVLENAKYLAKEGKLFEVRTVVVPELFDAVHTVRKSAKMLSEYLEIKDIRYKIITYRCIGVEKKYSHYTSPDRNFMEKLADSVREYGFKDIIIV